MFATDRDLLVLEPNLFRDVAWLGQRLLDVSGSTSGTTLTLASGDAAAVDITGGRVALVGGVPLEVVQRLTSTTLQVSRLRADPAAAPIPPGTLTSQPVVVTTFAPQTALAHAQILRMLGLDAAGTTDPDALDETAVTNPHALTLAESLLSLETIFTAASALHGPDSSLGRRAEDYRRRFALERCRAAAAIDLNGDGRPDTTRRLNVLQLIRV